MPTIENKDIGSWNMSLKEMNETFNEHYTLSANIYKIVTAQNCLKLLLA